MIDKQLLVSQLCEKLRGSLATAERGANASDGSDLHGATTGEQRAERRMERVHAERAARMRAEIEALASFRAPRFRRDAAIDLGALVDVEDDDGGRSFFLAPAGAGEELTGPGGDGFFSVVTPQSPIGRAVIGLRVGDVASVRLGSNLREWTIADVS